ncbi:hypothetical protein HDU77_001076 [Chytriomyces hyalinus]|nr:hypothetical protein HDU77_001076 [Chytriomyces hyalinus]
MESAEEVERQFLVYLSAQGMDNDPRLVSLPLASKKVMLAQWRRIQTANPTRMTQSTTSLSPSGDMGRTNSNSSISSNSGSMGSIFKRLSLTKKPSQNLGPSSSNSSNMYSPQRPVSPLPYAGVPHPEYNHQSLAPSSSSDNMYPQQRPISPLPHSHVPPHSNAPQSGYNQGYAQSYEKPTPALPPRIGVSEVELRHTFETILTKLNVTGRTRSQVIEMFSRTNLENKLAIVEKYKQELVASGIRSTSPTPSVNAYPTSPTQVAASPIYADPYRADSAQGRRVPTSVENQHGSSTLDAPRWPQSSQPPPALVIPGPQDWVERLSGAELDKQLDRVLLGMRITGYARTTVMNSTPITGKRNMIRQYYERTRLPIPADAFEPAEPTSPSSPVSSHGSVKDAPDHHDAPKSVEYYATLFMDQTTSPKSLLRTLTSLRVQLTLNPTPLFLNQLASVKVYVQSAGGISVTALEALHHLLARYNSKSLPQQETAQIKLIKQRYTEANTVQTDEMRVQILECLAIFPVDRLTHVSGLVATIMAVLKSLSPSVVPAPGGAGFSQFVTENLGARIQAADLAAKICVEGNDSEGYTRVVDALLNRHAGSSAVGSDDFLGEIIAGIVEPVVPGAGLQGRSVRTMPLSDPATQLELDPAVIWQYRGSLLELILAVVGASDDVKERVRLRKLVEAVGFKVVLEGFKSWIDVNQEMTDEKQLVLEVIDVYMEARADDLEELGEGAANAAEGSNRTPEDIVESILRILKSLPANDQQAKSTITLLLEHTAALAAAVQRGPDTPTILGSSDMITLSERITSITSQAVSPDAEADSSDMKENWTLLSESIQEAVESVAGFEIRSAEAGAVASRAFMDSESGGSSTNVLAANARLAKELEEMRVNYALSQSVQEDLTQEVVDLKEYISGRIENAANSSEAAKAAADDEIRKLRDMVAHLSIERDEAVRAAKEAAAKRETSGEEDGEVALETAPAARIRGRETINISLEKLDFLASGVPTKALEWSKLKPRAVQSSLWKELSLNAYKSDDAFCKSVLDDSELATVPQIFAKHVDAPASMALPFGAKKIALLEPSRAHTIEILLASVRGPDMKKLKHQEIKDGILMMNRDVLTMDNLNVLLQAIPTDAEIDLLASYKGDPTLLGNSEKFVRTVSAVPRLRARLEAIAFQQRLSEELSEIKPDLATVHKATKALLSSERFKKVLETVLIVGNFVNGNTYRGGAYGFEMDSLLKLKDTKADDASPLKDRAPTLLHYVARRLEEIDEDLLDLKAEIGPVESASRVVINALFSSVQELGAGFDDIKSELSVCEQLSQTAAEPGSEISFYDQLREFVSKNESKIVAIGQLSESVAKEVRDMLVYFGEDVVHREAPPQDFYKTIWLFQESLQRAYRENLLADEKAKQAKAELALSRRPILTPLQLKLKEKKNKLKAVDGEMAFTKRNMTVRRGRNNFVEEARANAGGAAGKDRMTSSIKRVLTSRKTLRLFANKASAESEKAGIEAVLSEYK